MNMLLLIWIGVLGLVLGSFLNVLIHRLPRGKTSISGRSICPHCGVPLRWYHNIPVISYLFLRGKCGFCRARISPRYPAVEIINAVFYLFFFSQLGFSWLFVAYAFLASALLAVFFIDLSHRIIPDAITLPGIVLGLAISLLPGGIGVVSALIGLLVGGGALYLIALLGDWLFKKESMGGGDIKLCAMLGAFLGWQKMVLIFLSSAGIGLVVSLGLMLISPRLRESRVVPFGPFLAVAAILAVLFGETIIDLYLVSVVGIAPR